MPMGYSYDKLCTVWFKTFSETAKGERIVNPAWSVDHVIDFNNASIIKKGNYRVGKFLKT